MPLVGRETSFEARWIASVRVYQFPRKCPSLYYLRLRSSDSAKIANTGTCRSPTGWDECRKVKPMEAAEKRMVTEEVHEDLARQMEQALMAVPGWEGFAQIIKDGSCKKRTGRSKE